MAELPARLPPTVNMHVVGHCNYACLYCYARFVESQQFLPLAEARTVIAALAARGVRRITFAGGEPTLHPDLPAMLDQCAQLGIVTSLVTNASRLDRDLCRRLFPRLRWLVLSCDSPNRTTNDALGRRNRLVAVGQPVRVEEVASWLHEWNAHREARDHVRLKINMVITSLNVHEDPSAWLRELRPERVKLLQCCIVPGENDDAAHLRCDRAAFDAYHARVDAENRDRMTIVAESSEDLLDSYAMIDPRGRFRQARAGGYVESAPIHEVGVDLAWAQVGGCDLERFRARGGEYDAGAPCRLHGPQIIAVEGLDGSGKSTAVRALAERLDAEVLGCPPAHMREERKHADALPAAQRREWYWNANRVALREATDVVFRGRRVVMDRSFVSTAAYGAAERGAIASKQDVPRDIPRPDVILLLTLPEDERQRRLRGRAGTATTEERRLNQDDAFRERVLAGYRAFGVIEIDARGSLDEIVHAAHAALVRGTP